MTFTKKTYKPSKYVPLIKKEEVKPTINIVNKGTETGSNVILEKESHPPIISSQSLTPVKVSDKTSSQEMFLDYTSKSRNNLLYNSNNTQNSESQFDFQLNKFMIDPEAKLDRVEPPHPQTILATKIDQTASLNSILEKYYKGEFM